MLPSISQYTAPETTSRYYQQMEFVASDCKFTAVLNACNLGPTASRPFTRMPPQVLLLSHTKLDRTGPRIKLL